MLAELVNAKPVLVLDVLLRHRLARADLPGGAVGALRHGAVRAGA